MLKNWRDEVVGALTYRQLAGREPASERRAILLRLADAEERHAALWASQLAALGQPLPDRAHLTGLVRGGDERLSTDAWLHRLEAQERLDARKYHDLLAWLPAGEARQAVQAMMVEEIGHAESIGAAVGSASGAREAVDRILSREHWHVAPAHGWIGDAIYGVNDGLGAIFGIVSGVAGYAGTGHLVVVAGLAGMVASALSMGSGAFLSAKSEAEIRAAEIARERRELEANPEEEKEELRLLYQLKGLAADEAQRVVDRLAASPEAMLRSLAAEELGLGGGPVRNPTVAAISAALSTALGAVVPVLPFLFLSGRTAVIVAASVSLAAHFAVGAAKTLITERSWLASGLEMTLVGAIEGAVTFALGRLLAGV